MSEVSKGFPALIDDHTTVLILGSLPSQKSLAATEYYAHPRNTFWRLLEGVANIDASLNYAERCQQMLRKRIGLWDVLASSVRPGSLDSSIEVRSAKVNNFKDLLRRYPGIGLICFNGRKAHELFRRELREQAGLAECRYLLLPSSSPAHAAMSFDKKLRRWRVIANYLNTKTTKRGKT